LRLALHTMLTAPPAAATTGWRPDPAGAERRVSSERGTSPRGPLLKAQQGLAHRGAADAEGFGDLGVANDLASFALRDGFNAASERDATQDTPQGGCPDRTANVEA
jgi:hypothetical protein